MATKSAPICKKHKIPKEWRPTVFEYAEQGISVHVRDVYAWVCPMDDEASFTPETTDELIVTVQELLETAKRARERQSPLTEYTVAVG